LRFSGVAVGEDLVRSRLAIRSDATLLPVSFTFGPRVRIWSQNRLCALGVDMAGKFVLKKGSTGKYHFNLVASNGQVIATSEAYERKQSALAGIESVKKNAPDAAIEDQTEE